MAEFNHGASLIFTIAVASLIFTTELKTIHRDHVLISLRDDSNQYLSRELIISERVNPELSSEIGLIKVISTEVPATLQTPSPWFHSWKLFRFGKLTNPATCSGAYLCTWRIVPSRNSKLTPQTNSGKVYIFYSLFLLLCINLLKVWVSPLGTRKEEEDSCNLPNRFN